MEFSAVLQRYHRVGVAEGARGSVPVCHKGGEEDRFVQMVPFEPDELTPELLEGFGTIAEKVTSRYRRHIKSRGVYEILGLGYDVNSQEFGLVYWEERPGKPTKYFRPWDGDKGVEARMEPA